MLPGHWLEYVAPSYESDKRISKGQFLSLCDTSHWVFKWFF
jgi:hypothetical protein